MVNMKRRSSNLPLMYRLVMFGEPADRICLPHFRVFWQFNDSYFHFIDDLCCISNSDISNHRTCRTVLSILPREVSVHSFFNIQIIELLILFFQYLAFSAKIGVWIPSVAKTKVNGWCSPSNFPFSVRFFRERYER